MMRVTRPIARGNTVLAQAFEVEPDPVTSDNVVPMSQRLSLLELNEATLADRRPFEPGFLLLRRQGAVGPALLRPALARGLSAGRGSPARTGQALAVSSRI